MFKNLKIKNVNNYLFNTSFFLIHPYCENYIGITQCVLHNTCGIQVSMQLWYIILKVGRRKLTSYVVAISTAKTCPT